MDWLYQHADLVSAFASVGMLVIWAIYAWLFFKEFKRARGSLLFIHEAGGQTSSSSCMLVNLSKEPVHILCSLAACDGQTIRLRARKDDSNIGLVQETKQGPLNAGEALVLGSFDDLFSELGLKDPAEEEDGHIVEVRVAAIHGFREWPVGARRRFELRGAANRIVPASIVTHQMRSKREAREVKEWVASCRDRTG